MKPILFNTDMVRAILDGRKTVTRRVVKPRYRDGEHGFQILTHKDGRFAGVEVIDENEFSTRWLAPPYQPGDILYVRETWARSIAGTYLYKATDTSIILDRWRPSIHMPKEAARLFLRVTDVRVERLLTPFFSDGAAVLALKKEGLVLPQECVECIGNYGKPACIDAGDDSECGILDEIRGDFSDLWNSTIKPADLPLYGWDANPWVWVIEFERVSKEAALKGGEG